MVKSIVKKDVKKVSVNFKSNVLMFLAEVIANSGTICGGTEIEDIAAMPTEVKIVKTTREPVLVFEVSGVTVKAAISVPKNSVEGEVIAVATSNTVEPNGEEPEPEPEEEEEPEEDTEEEDTESIEE